MHTPIETHEPAEARMEEDRPDVDYASGKDDPSKSDSPPASGTPSTAGELTQAEGERSQLATVFSVDAWLPSGLVQSAGFP